MSRPIHVITLLTVAAALLIVVHLKLGMTWPRFLTVAPGILTALLVAVAPTGRFLHLSIVLGWAWSLIFCAALVLALASPDFLTAGVLWAISFLGGIAVIFAIPAAVAIRLINGLRERGTT